MSLDPRQESISFNDFSFFIQAAFESEITLDKPLFNLSLVQESRLNHSVSFTEVIQLNRCKRSVFEDLNKLNYTDQFNFIGMENYLCPENTEQFQLAGIQQSNQYQNLKIIINQCIDSTKCLTQQEIQEKSKHNHPKITLGFTNSFMNVKESRLEPYIQIIDFLLETSEDYTRVDVSIAKTQFLDDQSILPFQEMLQSSVFYNVQQDIKIQQIHCLDHPVLAEVYISLSQTQQKIYKTYDRFDIYLAYIGGILQSVLFVMTCIVGYYNILANYLYTFDLKIQDQVEDLENLQQKIKTRVDKVRKAVCRIIKTSQLNIAQNHRWRSKLQLPIPNLQKNFQFQVQSPLRSEGSQKFETLGVKINDEMVYGDPLNTVSPDYRTEPFVDDVIDNGIQPVRIGKTNLRSNKHACSNSRDQSPQTIQNPQSLQDMTPKVNFQKQSANSIRQENLRSTFNNIDGDYEQSKQTTLVRSFPRDCTQQIDQGSQHLLKNTEQTPDKNGLMRGYDTIIQEQSDRQLSINEVERRNSAQTLQQMKDIEKQKKIISLFGAKRSNRLEINLDFGADDQESRRKSANIIIDPLRVKTEYHSRKDFLQSSIEDVMKYSRRIKMGIFNFLAWMCCRRYLVQINEKVNLIDRAVRMLRRDTDITSILYKLHDIDKLKKLMLSKDQNMLFNYTPKPVIKVRKSLQKLISVHDQEINSNQFRQETLKEIDDDLRFITKKQKNKVSLLHGQTKFESMKSFFKLYKAYDRLHQMNQNDISVTDLKVNAKLMHLIGEDLRTVFEASYLVEEQDDGKDLVPQSPCDPSNASVIISNIDEESADF